MMCQDENTSYNNFPCYGWGGETDGGSVATIARCGQ